VGAARFVPTAAILPSRRSTDAPATVGPAAVITVAFLMSVVREANARYVLGKGSAFGSDTAPSPGADFAVDAASCFGGVCGAGTVADCAGFAHVHATASSGSSFSLCIDWVGEGLRKVRTLFRRGTAGNASSVIRQHARQSVANT